MGVRSDAVWEVVDEFVVTSKTDRRDPEQRGSDRGLAELVIPTSKHRTRAELCVISTASTQKNSPHHSKNGCDLSKLMSVVVSVSTAGLLVREAIERDFGFST